MRRSLLAVLLLCLFAISLPPRTGEARGKPLQVQERLIRRAGGGTPGSPPTLRSLEALRLATVQVEKLALRRQAIGAWRQDGGQAGPALAALATQLAGRVHQLRWGSASVVDLAAGGELGRLSYLSDRGRTRPWQRAFLEQIRLAQQQLGVESGPRGGRIPR